MEKFLWITQVGSIEPQGPYTKTVGESESEERTCDNASRGQKIIERCYTAGCEIEEGAINRKTGGL